MTARAHAPATDPARVELADLAPALALFAQAVAGRRVLLTAIGDAAPDPRRDGADLVALALPASIAHFTHADRNRRAYRLAVLQALGGARRVRADGLLRRRRAPAVLLTLLDTLDAMRVDHAIAHRFAGMRVDLASERARRLSTMDARGLAQGPADATGHATGHATVHATASADARLRRLLADLARHALADSPEDAAPHGPGVALDPERAPPSYRDARDRLHAIAARMRSPDASFVDALRAARDAWRALAQAGLISPRGAAGGAHDPAPTRGGPDVPDDADADTLLGEAALARVGADDTGDPFVDGAAGLPDDALVPLLAAGEAPDPGASTPDAGAAGARAPDDAPHARAGDPRPAPNAAGAAGAAPADARAALEAGDGDAGAAGSDGSAADVARPSDAARRNAASPRTGGRALKAAHDARRAFRYDEWSYRERRYLRAHCRVLEARLAGDALDYLLDVKTRHAALAREVTRQFRAIRDDAWEQVPRSRDGEELDLDALVDAVVDRRAGGAGNELRVYRRRARVRRDIATVLLLDMSASTDTRIPDPARSSSSPAGDAADDDDERFPTVWGTFARRTATPAAPAVPARRVIDVAKESLALMGDALDAIGDDWAVYGFSGRGPEQVEFYVAKDFDEPALPRTWAGIAAIEPRHYTRMGPAIRHAVRRLVARPARTKLLIIVSDGYPQDQDYGPDRRDERYGIEDTAMALREAARASVQPFCVTIDRAGHDYLRRMCAPNRYLVIDEVAALAASLSRVYRAIR